MATKTVAWQTGSGNITLAYNGQGGGTIAVESDENNLDISRSQQVTVETTKGGTVSQALTITQAAGPNFRLSNGDAFAPADYDYMNVQTN
jgi:hypothetical protein